MKEFNKFLLVKYSIQVFTCYVNDFSKKIFIYFLKGVLMFTERLKSLRLEKKLTQKEIAQKLNISQQAYGQWETGKLNPKKETIQMFADFFNVSNDYLLGTTDKKDEELQILLRGTLEGLNDEQKQQFEIDFKEFLKQRNKLFED